MILALSYEISLPGILTRHYSEIPNGDRQTYRIFIYSW